MHEKVEVFTRFKFISIVCILSVWTRNVLDVCGIVNVGDVLSVGIAENNPFLH